MSKPTISKLFVGSLIAIFGGIVLAAIAGIAAVASGAFVWSGSEIVGFTPTAMSWSMIAIAAVGGLVIVAGAIGQFVAWIGAVLNTARLEDKTWFLVLLILGLLSFGFVAMIVYLIVGPDGTRPAIASPAYRPVASPPVASPPVAQA